MKVKNKIGDKEIFDAAIKIVSEYFGIEKESILNNNENRRAIIANQCLCWVIYEFYEHSHKDIGKLIGRDIDYVTNSINAVCDAICSKYETIFCFYEHFESIKFRILLKLIHEK
jgi:chromosomal replication initiation ATPase DnaA